MNISLQQIKDLKRILDYVWNTTPADHRTCYCDYKKGCVGDDGKPCVWCQVDANRAKEKNDPML